MSIKKPVSINWLAFYIGKAILIEAFSQLPQR